MSENRQGYARFTRKYGSQKYAEMDDAAIEKYYAVLPEYLIEIWKEHGLTCHADGYICLINPDKYISTFNRYIGTKSGIIPFAKNSFGSMYCYSHGDIYRFDPYEREVRFIIKMGMDDFFSYGMIDETSDDYRAHKKSLRKLGSIRDDQIFAYYPIVLSNSKSSDSKPQIVDFFSFTKELLEFIEAQE